MNSRQKLLYIILLFVANNMYKLMFGVNRLISLFILADGNIIKEFISRGIAGFIVNDACETKGCA